MGLEDAINGLSLVLQELNQSDDKTVESLKKNDKITDNKKDNEDEDLINNNDFRIQENKDTLPQMASNMSFGGDGQPFHSFMNNEADQQNNTKELSRNEKDLEEEAAILSTMTENIAIANKNNILKESQQIQKSVEPKQKTVIREDGIKKVDTKTNIVQETVVKYDTVVMNQADVEVFADLVQNGEVNLNNISAETAEKAVKVSKTLADILAKAMEDNKPVRIEFDNGISVIIKVSREGKITADFLPSTQVAEAYLKENLPILKQRFDEQNIDYDELNQRERKEQDKDNSNNKKKGRENE